MSSRSNANGKRTAISNDKDNIAQVPQLRRPRQPGDPLSSNHASPFSPGQQQTLGDMDSAFQTLSVDLQGIKQYVAHLEELLLELHSPQSIQYHVARLKARDSVANRQSARGRQRTDLDSPQHNAAGESDSETLFIPERGVSSRKRMQSVEAELSSKKARVGSSTSSGDPTDLGKTLLSRPGRLNSSSSDTISPKTARKPSTSIQQTATAQRAAETRQTPTTQQTATPQPTTFQMAKRLSMDHSVKLQEIAKGLAKDKSSKHPFYPACRWNERPTSNFQAVPKPAPAETTSQNAQSSVSMVKTPQLRLPRRDSLQSDGVSQINNKSKTPLPIRADADGHSAPPAPRSDSAARPRDPALRPATDARSDRPTPEPLAGARSGPPTPKAAADVRSALSSRTPSDARPATSATKRDTTVRSGSSASTNASDTRPAPPTPRSVPSRPPPISTTGRNPLHSIDAARSALKPAGSIPNTPVSSNNAGTSSSVKASPAVGHKLPARPQQSGFQNRPPRF
ncbi:hypothetical protein D6C89_02439 [Aureobasidium pullulans]|uniref:Uncharacterized protein n=1 Tax=Aureobasidium pullulans TaxID=5580 RepID=A0A4S8W9Y7_AURPU|nr:hypothetical protein D6D24_01508 [Aureobasidium pullulans]THZ28721.1 hypothetical protein D6C89_02439 [Aureobasidium pullulans]